MAKNTKKGTRGGNPKDKGLEKLPSDTRILLKEFGKIVKAKRDSQNLSLYDTENRDYPSWQHWQKLENGLKDIKFSTMVNICRALKIQPKTLFDSLKIKI